MFILTYDNSSNEIVNLINATHLKHKNKDYVVLLLTYKVIFNIKCYEIDIIWMNRINNIFNFLRNSIFFKRIICVLYVYSAKK